MDSLSPPSADERPDPPRRTSRALLLLGLTAITAGSVWGTYAWYQGRPSLPPAPPPPARLPKLLNTRPGVGYVGSARCAECHAAEAATYAEHPMGRSVSPADKWLPAQHQAVPSFEASGLHYAIERRDGKVFHREFVASATGPPPIEDRAEIAFAVGSGRQGQSFLVNRDGRLFQSPISWFVGRKAWGLSPGFTRRNQHFSRTITESCLFCHVNEVRPQPDTINQFVPAAVRLEPIGCERCHGPGELHLAAQQRGDRASGGDRTIVNPRRLASRLREAVCEQCHLQGETRITRAGKALSDYRPGLPLDEFVTVFVRPPDHADSRKAVSHVQQMHLSRCFRASGGEMGCISCHDPHVLPSERERVSWYRGRCLSCHQDHGCSLPVDERRRRNAADSCIDCHMPRGDSSNIAHTSITDHRIVRRSSSDAPEQDAADLVLVPFHSGVVAEEARVRRDLGLALVEMIERASPEARQRQLARQAADLLRPAIERVPEDVAALEALAQALRKDKRLRESLTSLDQALQRAPRRELALGTAALAALEVGETERSITYWRRLLDINPFDWQGHAYLGQALALRKQWAEAVDTCRRALDCNPFEPRTRMLLIDCLAHRGQRASARAEFDKLLTLRPPEPEKLRKWFDEVMEAARK
jgi:hypothetical protein